MSTITITRALSKIKILTSQIESDIKTSTFISTIPNNMVGSERHTKLVSELTGATTSLEDKIKQIIKLKHLIAESNLNSHIEILGKSVTVTEALAMKETMDFYSHFVLALRKQSNKVSEEVHHSNLRISQAIAGNNSDISSSSDIKNEDLEERLALNAKQLQESMGIQTVASANQTPEELISTVKNYHSTFLSEIDYLLSEHNATTSIELG